MSDRPKERMTAWKRAQYAVHAPDPVCECGHTRQFFHEGDGPCTQQNCTAGCTGWKEATE